MERRTRARGCHEVRSIPLRHLRRDGRRGRPRPQRGRHVQGQAAEQDARHRRRPRRARPGRHPHPRQPGRGPRRPFRHPDHRRPLRLRGERAHAGLPGGIRRRARALRRRLHGCLVQRAPPDRVGLRVRAGDVASRTATRGTVGTDLSARRVCPPKTPQSGGQRRLSRICRPLHGQLICLPGLRNGGEAGHLQGGASCVVVLYFSWASCWEPPPRPPRFRAPTPRAALYRLRQPGRKPPSRARSGQRSSPSASLA